MIDKTQRTRQQKRRQFLNQAAQAVGFASWSALETAVINGLFSLPLRGITPAPRDLGAQSKKSQANSKNERPGA